MNAGPNTRSALVPGYEDPGGGLYVFVCERCGWPRSGADDLCTSPRHAGSDGVGVGRAVRSSELARLAGAARAALGARR
jgi:hypothetical protein